MTALGDVWIAVNPPLRSGQHLRTVVGRRKDGSAWVGRVQNKGYEEAMRGLVSVLFSARPYPWHPLAEPVEVSLDLFLPHLKGTPKRCATLVLPLTTTPDWDNLAKLYGDALTRSGWLEDDKWIAVGRLAKFRSPVVGIRLRVARREPEPWSAQMMGGEPFAAT